METQSYLALAFDISQVSIQRSLGEEAMFLCFKYAVIYPQTYMPGMIVSQLLLLCFKAIYRKYQQNIQKHGAFQKVS